jgi:predicted dinucleotide-binding enzyme
MPRTLVDGTMNITVIGKGNVGGGLARLWRRLAAPGEL